MRHSLVLVMLSFLSFSSASAKSLVLSEEDLALERELKMLNKPYVKSFKDKYGVVFDCVDMYKQPAFNHPLLKNHKLQISPSSHVKSFGTSPTTTGQPTSFGLQESCPDGTVLIRRTLKEDLLRPRASSQVFKPQKDTSGIDGQHFAQLIIQSNKDSQFLDASAVIEVYPLSVPPGQSSSAQILLVDDSSSDVSVIQTGWLIEPDRDGEHGENRFMVYWTADDYVGTGCLNMRCPGFVQQSKTITPGMVISTGSITLNMGKDPQTGNWLVYFGEEMVGYFPKEIINNMNSSTEVQMGGIVYAPFNQKSPPMGSGVQPLFGSNNPAAKFKWIVLRGGTISNWGVAKDTENLDIYNVMVTSNSSAGPEGIAFQYGGPGGQLCDAPCHYPRG